ncbi:MAG: hypothetical protein JNM81_07920 [Rhodospirillaceae bacterium]|nr:hypothetical protein [Rhodospirillaceae bacterium]
MPDNRPTSVELLDAVQGFLKDDVLPKLAGADAYHLRVAQNALAILGREIALGPALDAAEQERLMTLLGAVGTRDELNAMLCAHIRDRKRSYKDPYVTAHLLQTAMGKMSIDNPKYATCVQELKRR